MLEPKQIEIDGQKFIISKFPATEGRKIITSYPLTAIPKVAEYSANEEIMYQLMSYVSIKTGSTEIPLINKDLINNHVKSWETLMKIEGAMIEYNCSFFQNGLVSTFLGDLAQKAPQWILKILTDFSEQSSRKTKRRSKS